VDLVVLTQNVLGMGPFWERRKRRLAALIRKVDPDVVGLQEVLAEGVLAQRSQAHELAALLPAYDVDFAPARVLADGRVEGLAVLHKHAVLERSVGTLTLDLTDRWERACQRVVLSCLLEVQGVRVQVVVAHLSLSHRARARTLAELSAAVAESRAKRDSELSVIVGDFNAQPGEEALVALCTQTHEPWVDAWVARHGARGGSTWPAPLPFRRIDYVFTQVPPAFGVVDCQRVMHAGSDHCALWARLRGDLPRAVHAKMEACER
jgi:endonuclease/exonuclease/phosphatase family metal-dependent hydrolase